MSFPNPDNYARDCDCGTAGANTTPPPAQLITEAEAAILTNPLILPLGGSIDTKNKNGTGGYIKTSGDEGGQNGGYIDTSATNGGSSGGYINTTGSDNPGGYIDTRGTSYGSGGFIKTSGSSEGNGGYINTSAGTYFGASGGSINTSDGGGSINTSGFSQQGGSIDTSDGGGSINTRGTGSIEFGIPATRTILNGSATSYRTVTLPNITGTLPIALISASTALNFPNIISNNFQDLTITLTGAATSDVVFVTCISGGRTAPDDTKLLFEAFVSASNTVTVRAHNKTPGDINPASYNFKVAIIKTA